MLKKAAISVLLFVAVALFLLMVPAQAQGEGCKNIITLPNGEVVCDLNGEWDYTCIYKGAFSGLRPSKNVLKITQEGKTFASIRLTDDIWHAKGNKVLRGELDTDHNIWGCRGLTIRFV